LGRVGVVGSGLNPPGGELVCFAKGWGCMIGQ
jgi:hypothetical protein